MSRQRMTPSTSRKRGLDDYTRLAAPCRMGRWLCVGHALPEPSVKGCLVHEGAKGYEKIQHFAEWRTLLVVEEYDRRIHAHRATAMFTLGGVAAFPLGDCGERLAYSGRPRESGGWSR